MITESILLAGGFGTRLQKVVSDVPKPMASVAGRPFIEFILDYLIDSGIQKFVFSVGYKSEFFISYFGEKYKKCTVEYSVEESPLGTGGGIRKAIKKISTKEVLVLNADSIFKIDIAQFYKQHKKTNADLSIALKKLDDVSRYGSVEIDEDMRVTAFTEKNAVTGSGHINGGVYIFKKDFFELIDLGEKFSLEKDCLEKECMNLKIGGFPSNAYFRDIGIPEDYEKACKELA